MQTRDRYAIKRAFHSPGALPRRQRGSADRLDMRLVSGTPDQILSGRSGRISERRPTRPTGKAAGRPGVRSAPPLLFPPARHGARCRCVLLGGAALRLRPEAGDPRGLGQPRWKRSCRRPTCRDNRARVETDRWIAFHSHFNIESFYDRPGVEGARPTARGATRRPASGQPREARQPVGAGPEDRSLSPEQVVRHPARAGNDLQVEPVEQLIGDSQSRTRNRASPARPPHAWCRRGRRRETL